MIRWDRDWVHVLLDTVQQHYEGNDDGDDDDDDGDGNTAASAGAAPKFISTPN